MTDVKHFVELCSDWLLGHIQTQIIRVVFTTALAFQIANWLHVPIFPIYSGASHVMDVVWWVDVAFTAIAAVNWFVRKLWESL